MKYIEELASQFFSVFISYSQRVGTERACAASFWRTCEYYKVLWLLKPRVSGSFP
jgi:hypothetical protein